LGLHGPVDGIENVRDRVRIEIGGGCYSPLFGELESGLECFHCSVRAIATCATKFNEIVGGGNGDEQSPIVV
jgi:hypothetical protein